MTEEEEQQQQSNKRLQSSSSCFQLIQNAISNPDQLTAMISNYSTSYNAVNVGIVIPVLNYSILESNKSSSGDDESYSTPENYYYAAEAEAGEHGAPSASSVLSIVRGLITIIDNNNNTNTNTNEEHQGTKNDDDEQESLVASSLLAGMILGQLIGGYLGDILGRRTAMMLVMMLQIGGSLGSAFFISTAYNDNDDYGSGNGSGSSGGGLTVMEQLAIWRFILGIGAGGVYPLAAVMSAENKQEENDERNDNNNNNNNSMTAATVIHDNNNMDGGNEVLQNEDNDNNNGNTSISCEQECHHEEEEEQDDQIIISSFQRIALTFSTQGLGFITVPILAYPMLELKMNTDIIWRVLLGVGAIPGFVVLYLRLCRGGKSCFRRRKDERQLIIADDTLDNDDESENNMNDLNLTSNSNANDVVGGRDEVSMMNNSTSAPTDNTSGSLELATVDAHLQAAVSTLFSSEITSSGSDNEMALMGNNNTVDGNYEEHASNGADDMSPPIGNHSRSL